MRRTGVLAKKIGRSALFQDNGLRVPVTLLKCDHCCVLDSRPSSQPGWVHSKVGAGLAKNVSKPLAGYFTSLKIRPRFLIKEFKVTEDAVEPLRTVLGVDFFSVGSFVDVSGISLGHGFSGAMRRHNFSGLRASHGVSVSHRSHGSTGNRKDPGRVFKGKKMAGHWGCDHVTVQNLQIIWSDVSSGIMALRGSVPGFSGGWVSIRDSIKKIFDPNSIKRIPLDTESFSSEDFLYV